MKASCFAFMAFFAATNCIRNPGYTYNPAYSYDLTYPMVMRSGHAGQAWLIRYMSKRMAGVRDYQLS